MAMMCDACGTKFMRDNGGHSNLSVTPPRPDFKMIQARMNAGRSFEVRDHQTLDICLGCTVKVLAHLGLPTDICDVPQMPEPTEPTDPPGAPLAGALTPEDLKALGIEPNTP